MTGAVRSTRDQQREPVGHPLQHLGHRHRGRAGGGQLDRQRQSFQELHQGADRRLVGVDPQRLAASGDGTLLEQRHGIGPVERLQDDAALSAEAQPVAAGHEKARVLGPVEPETERRTGRAHDLLEVVEDEEATPAAGQHAGDPGRRVGATERHVQDVGDRPAHVLGRPRRRQVAEPDTAWKVAQPRPAEALCEARLADTAEPEERDAPGTRLERLPDGIQRRAPADEGIAIAGEVVRLFAQGHPEAVATDDAPGLLHVDQVDRRGVGPDRLEQMDRLGDALQAPPGTIAQLRMAARQDGARIGGDEGLARLRERGHARRQRLGDPLDGNRLGAATHVRRLVRPQQDLAEVHAGTSAQGDRQGAKGPVVGRGVVEGVGGVVEHQQEAVAAVDLLAVPAPEQLACSVVVRLPEGAQGVRIEALRQQRAVDDVGDEQGLRGRHPSQARRWTARSGLRWPAGRSAPRTGPRTASRPRRHAAPCALVGRVDDQPAGALARPTSCSGASG